MTTTPGYSGTPLARKLGVKAESRIKTKGAPANYAAMLGPLPKGAVVSARMRPPVDLWHLFATSRRDLASGLPAAMREIRQDGMIWVSWPKRSSGVATDLTEDVIRDVAIPLGLVDVKVCAVDQTWSGLKLVIRLANRK